MLRHCRCLGEVITVPPEVVEMVGWAVVEACIIGVEAEVVAVRDTAEEEGWKAVPEVEVREFWVVEATLFPEDVVETPVVDVEATIDVAEVAAEVEDAVIAEEEEGAKLVPCPDTNAECRSNPNRRMCRIPVGRQNRKKLPSLSCIILTGNIYFGV